MKQILFLTALIIITNACFSQATLYDAKTIKARAALVVGGKTVTDIVDDTVMANKYQSRIMTEWATKNAIQNIMATFLTKTDTANKWMPKTHTVNSIANGTGFLKNNGSGTWSYDNNNYITSSSGANQQVAVFTSGLNIASYSSFKFNNNQIETSQTNTSSSTGILISQSYNNLGIRIGNGGLATNFAYVYNNNTSLGSNYANVLGMNSFYDGTNWFTKNGYTEPSTIMLKGTGEIEFYTNQLSQGGTPGIYTPSLAMKLKTNGSAEITGTATALSFIKSGGTSSQFLKANGSVDNNTYLTTTTAASTYIPQTHTTNNIANGTGFLKNNGSGTWSYDNTNYTPKPKIVKYGGSTYTLSGDENYVFAENDAEITLPLLSGVADGYIIEFGLINTSSHDDQYEVICNGSDVFDVPLNCTNLFVQTAGGDIGSVSVLSTKIMADKTSGKWLVLQATKMGCY